MCWRCLVIPSGASCSFLTALLLTDPHFDTICRRHFCVEFSFTFVAYVSSNVSYLCFGLAQPHAWPSDRHFAIRSTCLHPCVLLLANGALLQGTLSSYGHCVTVLHYLIRAGVVPCRLKVGLSLQLAAFIVRLNYAIIRCHCIEFRVTERHIVGLFEYSSYLRLIIVNGMPGPFYLLCGK